MKKIEIIKEIACYSPFSYLFIQCLIRYILLNIDINDEKKLLLRNLVLEIQEYVYENQKFINLECL